MRISFLKNIMVSYDAHSASWFHNEYNCSPFAAGPVKPQGEEITKSCVEKERLTFPEQYNEQNYRSLTNLQTLLRITVRSHHG